MADPDRERRKTRWSRRRSDKQLLRRLIGIAIFLFVVNTVLGAYVIKTLPAVNTNTQAVTVFACTQNSVFRSARDRERLLAEQGHTSKSRRAHRRSAHQLDKYLAQIEPLVDCKSVRLPPSPGPKPKR